MAWRGITWHLHGMVWHGMARHNTAWQGMVLHGIARPGALWDGMALHGMS
jgi:hypothetical protein